MWTAAPTFVAIAPEMRMASPQTVPSCAPTAVPSARPGSRGTGAALLRAAPTQCTCTVAARCRRHVCGRARRRVHRRGRCLCPMRLPVRMVCTGPGPLDASYAVHIGRTPRAAAPCRPSHYVLRLSSDQPRCEPCDDAAATRRLAMDRPDAPAGPALCARCGAVLSVTGACADACPYGAIRGPMTSAIS